ncbi:heavy-metal-associated domain-containing protein [Amycolatopsis jiangsuensis]|uniref:Copper chaperone CopZ n=1 Tax=Amycolatopsis jiangsuensis TaxID=1181879 RepID=A0A840IZX9_9PSEU|nr:cation transporter [Amycolatopsis jiangsuensis]MBB4686718.1 copper chaperone CopZ [Amycolatopsis jiangsuensis]
MIDNEYLVSGMSCGHCAQSVTEELTALPGVEAVTVDVETGKVTVRSTEPVAESSIRAAVDEAGYTYEGFTATVRSHTMGPSTTDSPAADSPRRPSHA